MSGRDFTKAFSGKLSEQYGMDLRDYFAAKAIDFMLNDNLKVNEGISFEDVASDCYDLADAMLKQREE